MTELIGHIYAKDLGRDTHDIIIDDNGSLTLVPIIRYDLEVKI